MRAGRAMRDRLRQLADLVLCHRGWHRWGYWFAFDDGPGWREYRRICQRWQCGEFDVELIKDDE